MLTDLGRILTVTDGTSGERGRDPKMMCSVRYQERQALEAVVVWMDDPENA